jgi:hypothetical protein
MSGCRWYSPSLNMAISLRVLPDSYREHFAQCKLQTVEEWLTAYGRAVMRPLWAAQSPLEGRHQADTSRTVVAVVATAAAITVAVETAKPGAAEAAVAVTSDGTGPQHLGEPLCRMAVLPMPTVETFMTGPTKGPVSVSTTSTIWQICHPLQTALHLPAGKRDGRWQQLSPLQSVAAAAPSRQRLHPTTNLVFQECTVLHTFLGHAKLCFIRDGMSNKDFLAYTGGTLSLLSFQSAAAATGPHSYSGRDRFLFPRGHHCAAP